MPGTGLGWIGSILPLTLGGFQTFFYIWLTTLYRKAEDLNRYGKTYPAWIVVQCDGHLWQFVKEPEVMVWMTDVQP